MTQFIADAIVTYYYLVTDYVFVLCCPYHLPEMSTSMECYMACVCVCVRGDTVFIAVLRHLHTNGCVFFILGKMEKFREQKQRKKPLGEYMFYSKDHFSFHVFFFHLCSFFFSNLFSLPYFVYVLFGSFYFILFISFL